MLTPGISVKAITFRRDGFRQFENMNRKKTKNLLVLLVLSSACVAGYLVFYRNDLETREAGGGGIKNMHIHHKGKSGHRHRVGGFKSGLRKDEDDDDSGRIGMKLFPHGVDKAAFAKGEERDWIRERPGDDNENDAERRLEGRLRSRLEERHKLKKAHRLVDDDDAGDISNVEEEEERVEDAEMPEERAEEGEEEDAENDEEEDPAALDAEAERNAAVLNLQERLKARLDEHMESGDDRLEHAGVVDIGVDKAVPPGGQDIGDEPIENVDDPDMIMPFDERSFNREPKQGHKVHFDFLGDDPAKPVKPKPFGVENNVNHFQDFGRQENQANAFVKNHDFVKQPLRVWEDENVGNEEEAQAPPMQMPNQLKQFGDPDRVKQHLAELNGQNVQNEPEVYQGPGFYNKNRHKEQKIGGMDAFLPKKKLYDRNPAFNAAPKRSGLKVDNHNPFGGRKPGEPEGGFNNPFLDKKDDAFGAFRGHGNVGADGLGEMPNQPQMAAAHAPQEEKEDEFEGRYIDKNGLLKGGAGHAPLRPFGEAGVNPFRNKAFNDHKVNRKSNLLVPEGHKVHFDFRDKEPAGPGLLVEDDDNNLVAPNQPGLPPEVPQEDQDEMKPNEFGEIPVPPPKQIGAMNHLHEVPVAPPNQFGGLGNHQFGGAPAGNQLHQLPVANENGEVPVESRLNKVNNNAPPAGGGSGVNVHDVNGRMDTGAECMPYTFPSEEITGAKICVHSEGSDLVSDTIRTEHMWEPLLMRQLVGILSAPDNWNLHLIDIGAGIGVFSMCAALMSRNVLAVEPLPVNYRLLHQNAFENLVGPKITLVTQALDNTSYVGQMSPATSAEGGYSNTHVTKVAPGMSVDPKNEVNVTTLDALAEVVSFTSAVMKIDVTDNKVYNILSGGRQFFEKIKVKYILSHWKKSSSTTAHVRMMLLMSELGFAPHRTWDGPTLEMQHLQLDQSFLIWKYIKNNA